MISLPPLVDRVARILISSPEGGLLSSVRSTLLDEGHEVVLHRDARSLVAAVLEERVDLVLLDVDGPFEQALEAVGDLRMVDEGRLVPLMLASCSGRDEFDVVRGLLAGADDFLTGTRVRELAARVLVQLRNRRDRELLRYAERERGELHNAAWTDPLTGLGNRRAADHFLKEALVGSESVLVMITDLDHFKHVNDTWGHAAGDRVLQTVGAALRRMARDGDQVARFGGEEFLVVIRDAPTERHRAIAERLLGSVRSLSLPPGVGPTSITASVGAVSWSASDGVLPVTELFRRADESLYEAKRTGRDRLVMSSIGEERVVPASEPLTDDVRL